MLRLYFLQHWFNLSDPGVEEALYDSATMRAFVGIDLGREPVPDETTMCRFRHLLEEHGLGPQLFEEVGRQLHAQGLTVSTGTIVDATIIAAPSSTKNATGTRDPEMHQTKKGQQWYFGMKAHLGVDSRTKLIHAVTATAANVHDSQVLPALLHGRERRVWGDSAYTGQGDTIRACAPHARDFTQRKATAHHPLSRLERAKNREKSRVRAKVEHPIGVLKRVFGFTKVCYRGLAKNTHRLVVAWPFPEKRLRELSGKVQCIIMVELNLGQMYFELERVAAGRCETRLVGHAGGTVHEPEVICNAILEVAR